MSSTNQNGSGLITSIEGIPTPTTMYAATIREQVPEEFVELNTFGRKQPTFFYTKEGYKEPGVHRVEFIIWKEYWICNVQIDGRWRHISYPNTTTMAEFLANGAINKAVTWPEGRMYVSL